MPHGDSFTTDELCAREQLEAQNFVCIQYRAKCCTSERVIHAYPRMSRQLAIAPNPFCDLPQGCRDPRRFTTVNVCSNKWVTKKRRSWQNRKCRHATAMNFRSQANSSTSTTRPWR